MGTESLISYACGLLLSKSPPLTNLLLVPKGKSQLLMSPNSVSSLLHIYLFQNCLFKFMLPTHLLLSFQKLGSFLFQNSFQGLCYIFICKISIDIPHTIINFSCPVSNRMKHKSKFKFFYESTLVTVRFTNFLPFSFNSLRT